MLFSTCESCGARSGGLRRNRCAVCYLRWVESRPVGAGATCVLCSERRQAHLHLVEFQSRWLVMCHNCSAKTFRLSPMPKSLDGLRQRLVRDRRHNLRRRDRSDGRLFPKNRRCGDRRTGLLMDDKDWVDASDLVVEAWESPDIAEEHTCILHLKQ
jgi:hypothetical protein